MGFEGSQIRAEFILSKGQGRFLQRPRTSRSLFACIIYLI